MNSVSPPSPASAPFMPSAPDAVSDAEGPPAFAKALDKAVQARNQTNATRGNAEKGNAERANAAPASDDADPATARVAQGRRAARQPVTRPRETAADGVPATPPLADADSRPAGAADAHAGDRTGAPQEATALPDLAAWVAGLPHSSRALNGRAAAHDGAAVNDGGASTAAARTGGRDAGRNAARALAAGGQVQELAVALAHEQAAQATATPHLFEGTTGRPGEPALKSVIDGTAGAISGSALSAAGGPAAPFSALAAGPASAAGLVQAELTTALGTPEFAAALGAQVSVLVRDGITHARLQLNPAEMGPIGISIRLDGDLAQVDFNALHVQTRQALEDAVPALASALREAGLTLSGGGVFEQPQQPADSPKRPAVDSGTHAGTTDGASPAASASAASAPRRHGIVDLYA